MIQKVISANDFIFAFLTVGTIMFVSYWISKRLTDNKIPGTAIAIMAGLALAALGGRKGIADIPIFSGMALLGGAMMRDFSVVATAMGANYTEIKKAGLAGIISLLIGVFVAFFVGGTIGYAMGYTSVQDFTTIGAGACSFVVGPITGSAIGAPSDVIAISIAIGVVKSIMITIGTPIIAKHIGLDNPHAAMVFGGLIGTTSGVAAGLAATDPKLVPYGALTATFYTGIGALLCPTIFYFIVQSIL
ncbi:MAG: malonate transporter subunit MadM [Cyclobacteriaceae bacterium]|nr:malonate transporter subunit MadM [Cyclobacteriaceae bacterium]